jgi:glucose/arabinose dehydrogenase
VSEAPAVFAEGAGLNLPNDLAFTADGLYVANTDSVVKWSYAVGDLAARGPAAMVLPLPGAGVGWRRALASAPDGALFVSVGASCNVCTEEDPRRAAVLRYVPGRPLQAFANGLRAVGDLAVDPRTGSLWATDLGRSGLGDDQPPEELDLITAGGNYGWPWCFGQRMPDTSLGAQAVTCASTVPPVITFGARTEPLGMAFGAGASLPPEWRDDLFVALHGSSAGLPVGFKIVRVPFAGGGPSGEAQDFVTGWLRADTRRWGRPSSIAVAPDGALLIGDEGGQRVYRVTYVPATPVPTPIF